MNERNPLLEPWRTPFGVPPFAEIEPPHFLPAFEAAMAEHRREIEAVAADTATPNFANTIEAFERAGEALDRLSRVFFALDSAHSNEDLRATALAVAPALAGHEDDLFMNEALFARVQAVYEDRAALELEPEALHLLEETHKSFVRSGAQLDRAAQARLREINGEAAELAQTFGQNLLAENSAFEIHTDRRGDLGALPAGLAAAAAEEARLRGHAGGWSFTLAQPSVIPFLQYSPNRALREAIFEAYVRRGDNGGASDNNAALSRLAKLRAERARLLGHETHAHFVLSDNMAETPERVFAFLDQMWGAASRVAERELGELTAEMRRDGAEGRLEGWDWRYYAEKLKNAQLDLDEQTLRAYFEITAVREGAFKLAGELFGLTFHVLAELPVWHPDQEAYEVREADGTHLGVLYMDFFSRESKRGGAWMNALRVQSRLGRAVTAVISTNFNFAPPTAEAPSLLSYRETQTVFHEFGHALHGLLSNVTYPSLSGTNVPRDFVEFPSQMLENWMREPEMLRLYARHHETGEAIPDELVAKIHQSEAFNQGFATVEYMAASYLDLAWHTLRHPSDGAESPRPGVFEAAEMKRLGLIEQIPPRYRSTNFAHIFAGGYSAGYYSYLWAEVLDADAFEAFRENGIFDRATARRYRELLSRGGSRPGMELYERFRGRAPEIAPLLERRGLLETEPAARARAQSPPE
jgi:peptidyl-dipeptidase Dcp